MSRKKDMSAASEKVARNDPVVGKNIRRMRAAAGISQTELGNRVGVTFQQIQKYEKGANACPPGRLRQIAAVLKTTPAAFFGDVPAVGGEEVPLERRRDYQTLIALGKIKSDALRASIENMII